MRQGEQLAKMITVITVISMIDWAMLTRPITTASVGALRTITLLLAAANAAQRQHQAASQPGNSNPLAGRPEFPLTVSSVPSLSGEPAID